MGFSYNDPLVIVRTITNPGADAKVIHLWKADQTYEILSAYIAVQDAQGAGSAGAFALLNYGTAGTAVKSGGTVGTRGGTSTTDRLSAATPYAYTITEGTVASGEWIVCKYTETGDWVETNVTIQITAVRGIGA